MSFYAIAVLGSPTDDQRRQLTATVLDMVDGFGLAFGRDLVFHDAADLDRRDIKASTAAVYFADDDDRDLDQARALLKAGVPIIPTIAPGRKFNEAVPDILLHANGLQLREDDPALIGLAGAVLECVGLLRKQRRVFISYRRDEASLAAIQLHDLMASRGFEVFLDTHGIRPGDPFQDVLWHKLVDSDVLVMLDTPGYFDSAWTRQEIGRALAIDVNVLRVVWPDHEADEMTDLSETVYLAQADLEGPKGPFAERLADSLVPLVERLRSRGIASRYRAMTGKLRAEVASIRAEVDAIGAFHAIGVRLRNGALVWAFPIIGVPTAETLNDIADKAERAGGDRLPVLLYDHRGIREPWRRHLRWLGERIPAVQLIPIADAGWVFPELKGG